MATPLLSAFYFGTVDHYRLIAQHDRVLIDIGEHFERQSFRTRTSIAGPNGKQDLVVQIARKSGEKMPMREVGLSYTETWQQQHLHAIRSAYGKTPWFIHYIDDIEAVLTKKHERLVDLDLATMRLGLKWLGLVTELVVEESYVVGAPKAVVAQLDGGMDVEPPPPPPIELLDLRQTLHPKKPLPAAVTPVSPYPQVFAYRLGYVPGLSVIDLVMNTGPKAASILRAG
ncbi:MAG: WbqC family protein [Flavobacteriales bacterium]|nr:WbqC family protein [Flavobacteriales bacterium]